MNPSYYSVYKSKGAFQLKFVPPKPVESNPWEILQGFLLIEFANSIGNKKLYNWKEKITMKLGLRDISQILVDVKAPDGVKIVHDPKAGTEEKGKFFKTLTVKKGQKAGTFFWTLSSTTGGAISVPVDKYEQTILFTFLKYSMPKLLAW